MQHSKSFRYIARTLTFIMMRTADIPQGDLFTVLEASSPEHIKQAMEVILDIEAEAAAKVSMKPGLIKILTLLRDNKVRHA
jgi:hypothetical protein